MTARVSSQLHLFQSLRRSVKRCELFREIRVSIVYRIRLVKDLKFFCADSAPADESIEVDDVVPVLVTEQHHRHRLTRFLGLNQRQHLEEFIHRAETAGKNHERFRQINKPEFAHEEVMKVE